MHCNWRSKLSLILAVLLMTAALGSTALGESIGAIIENQSSLEIPVGESVSQDTDLVAAVTVDFTTMDPVDTSDTLSGGIQRLIMDGLFGFDDDMALVNMLATGYEANDDATEYTIFLRQGIAFTDGTPWNADALMANLAKWDDKSLALKRTALLSDVLDSWEGVDEYTVKIRLAQSFGSFINTLAHPATVVMSPKQIEQGVDVAAEAPIGTGQYTFVEWIRGDHLTLALNKDWWGYDPEQTDGTPFAAPDAGFKTITFKPVPEGATRVAMIQSGDAQLIWTVPSETLDMLRNDSAVTLGIRKSLVAYYIFLNTQKAPYSDKRVRQAINYAIDKNAYLAVVQNGSGSLPTSIIGPDTQYATQHPMYEYDVEKSKALLAEAGYPDGFKASIIASNSSANVKAGEFLKQQLGEVGIELDLQLMESAIVNSKIQDVDVPGAEAEVEMYLSGWSSSTGDSDWAIRPLFDSASIPPNNFNISYYSNPEVDALLKEGLSTADPEVRAAAYAKVQDILWDDSPVVTTYIGHATWATSAKLINVSIYPDGAINLRAGRLAK
ncbi:glutathione ABC transporter substrate-binding protein GsiB [Clostridia bacterium]|nr:glutathione ABC transporter substrate-binding protein GsiB [Clostridia bacterium]